MEASLKYFFILVSFFLLTLNHTSSATTQFENFLQRCEKHALNPICNSYLCFSKHHYLDLRLLSQMKCNRQSDCNINNSGFICVKYDEGKGYCECPRNMGYNSTSCKCEYAELCPNDRTNTSVKCYGGMMCPFTEGYCSCNDLSSTLFDPQGRFCVLPRSSLLIAEEEASNQAVWIVLLVIGSIVALTMVGILLYTMSDDFTCKKGDYKCENENMDNNDSANHIAAWDMPSLDYLSEEQTMKYIKKHRNNLGNTENSSDTTNGSLPESERPQQQYGPDHVNAGYVRDHDADIIIEAKCEVTSQCHDV